MFSKFCELLFIEVEGVQRGGIVPVTFHIVSHPQFLTSSLLCLKKFCQCTSYFHNVFKVIRLVTIMRQYQKCYFIG